VKERMNTVEDEAEQRVRAESTRASTAVHKAEELERQYRLLRRRVVAAGIFAAVLVLAIWLVAAEQISSRWFIGVLAGAFAALAYGWGWLTRTEVTAGRFVSGFAAEVLLLLAGALFST
jgi:hypothetical protein